MTFHLAAQAARTGHRSHRTLYSVDIRVRGYSKEHGTSLVDYNWKFIEVRMVLGKYNV